MLQRVFILTLCALSVWCGSLSAQNNSPKSVVRGGRIVLVDTPTASNTNDTETPIETITIDSLSGATIHSVGIDQSAVETLAITETDSIPNRSEQNTSHIGRSSLLVTESQVVIEEKKVRQPYFSDSMSFNRVAMTSAILPGFGQIYNKQYWKLPIVYGAIGGSIALLAHENKTWYPIKKEYEDYTLYTTERSDYLDALQTDYIRSKTRRSIYIGMVAASAIYAMGDAAINYSSGDVADISKATTLSLICPGAGQIYNKSYWKLPIIVGGMTTMVFVYDWNNRGYVRFNKAYQLLSEYTNDPDAFPNGYPDEFSGRYSLATLKGWRDSYRRNRDLSIILTAGLYIFQVIDAHVDAHLKDFDVSNDLAFNVEPLIDYAYSPTVGGGAVYGLNIGFKF